MSDKDSQKSDLPSIIVDYIDTDEHIENIYRPSSVWLTFRMFLAILIFGLMSIFVPIDALNRPWSTNFGDTSMLDILGPTITAFFIITISLISALYIAYTSYYYIITDKRFILIKSRPLLRDTRKSINIDSVKEIKSSSIPRKIKIRSDTGTKISFLYLLDNDEVKSECERAVS